MLDWLYTLLYRSTRGNLLPLLSGYGKYSPIKTYLQYKVTGKHTSTSNRSLMKYEYLESQKPPETNAAEWLAWRKLVSKLIMLLFILIFTKQLLTELTIVSWKESWMETARDRAGRKKPTPLKKLHWDHIKTGEISYCKFTLHNV